MGKLGNIWQGKPKHNAEQGQARDPPHAPKWTPVDTATVKAFIGLVFLHGYH